MECKGNHSQLRTSSPGLALAGKALWGKAISYSLVQISAGLCAGLSMYGFVNDDAVNSVNADWLTLHIAFCE
eukprot:2480699-Amphidinium_carterae.1